MNTKYITPDEFKLYTGRDLNYELHDDDNTSNKAFAFLNRIEVRMSAYIDANYNRNIDAEYPVFSDYQKEHYKYALLEQALYVLNNGEISQDSGYDPEHGVVANTGVLKYIKLSDNAREHLVLCGLLNRQLRGRGLWWM